MGRHLYDDDWMDIAKAVGVDRTPVYAQVLAEHRVEAGIDATATAMMGELEAFLATISPLCSEGTDVGHARCAHPSNVGRYGECGCPCHDARRAAR